MLILPVDTDLRLGKRPYITYLIIVICLVTYFLQSENKDEIYDHISTYCSSVYTASKPLDALDFIITDEKVCLEVLHYLHERESHKGFEVYEEKLSKVGEYTPVQIHEVISYLHHHLEELKLVTPTSIDSRLMHFPNELNPIPMITSAIAHADWEHVIFNLVFFIAFAPALEILIGNRLKYLGLLVAISLVTSVSYAVSVLITSSEPLPSLGLSGVVMGMIGMSAYLMPMARIKIFVWLIVAYKHFYIPAWILAVYYIGDDVWTMFSSTDYGGINVVAHASGGIAGYILGYAWFNDRKKDIQDELDDEIEYQKEERSLNKSTGSVQVSRKEFKHKQQVKQFKHTEDAYFEKLHHLVRTRRDSEAVVLILSDYELQSASPIIFEELFVRVKLWGDSLTVLCLGRLVINLLIEQRKYAKALLIVEQCQVITEEFVLANPINVLLLARIAQESQQYQVAYLLVRDAYERYGEYIDYDRCVLMELDFMMHYLNMRNEAKTLIQKQINIKDNPIKKKLILLKSEIIS